MPSALCTEGAASQSPASRSARWVRNVRAEFAPKGLHQPIDSGTKTLPEYRTIPDADGTAPFSASTISETFSIGCLNATIARANLSPPRFLDERAPPPSRRRRYPRRNAQLPRRHLQQPRLPRSARRRRRRPRSHPVPLRPHNLGGRPDPGTQTRILEMGENDERHAPRFPLAKRLRRFSVSPAHVEPLRSYIANQEEHHRTASFQDEFRQVLKKYGLEWDERYVWD
jgi:hypothetical protein